MRKRLTRLKPGLFQTQSTMQDTNKAYYQDAIMKVVIYVDTVTDRIKIRSTQG